MIWAGKIKQEKIIFDIITRQRVDKSFIEDKGKCNWIKSDIEDFPVYCHYTQFL